MVRCLLPHPLAPLLVFTLGTAAASAQTAPEAAVARALAHPGVEEALSILERDHDRMVEDIITLTEIPAPPFQEDERAAAYTSMLREAGLTNVEQDAEGNIIGLRRGSGDGPLIAVAAHLDTVFPADTDVTVTRQGTRLSAPGIGDNTRGLAVLLAVVRALNAAEIETVSDVLFIGNVGEEGPGDLRGMKYLFNEGPYRDRIAMFVSVDGGGAGNSITNGGVGSRRYRVTFTGPGGHSYGAFGLVNPAYALGVAMQQLSETDVPSSPRTTYSVGVIGGGTSVNSIPAEVWAEVDLRSESPEELARLDQRFVDVMLEAAASENEVRSTDRGAIEVDVQVIGDRPSGETSRESDLVKTAAEVIRQAGMTPVFSASSTDANIPMSLGIPAITVDSGGKAGRSHAPDEWIDVEPSASLPGVRNVLVLVAALAGLP